jgi:hypothetical protein
VLAPRVFLEAMRPERVWCSTGSCDAAVALVRRGFLMVIGSGDGSLSLIGLMLRDDGLEGDLGG